MIHWPRQLVTNIGFVDTRVRLMDAMGNVIRIMDAPAVLPLPGNDEDVHHVRQREGLERTGRRMGRPASKEIAERNKRIIELYKQGARRIDLATDFNLTENTIYDITKGLKREKAS